jgi:hypothetical protein
LAVAESWRAPRSGVARASAASRIFWILYSYFPWVLATRGGVAGGALRWILLRATAGALAHEHRQKRNEWPREGEPRWR